MSKATLIFLIFALGGCQNQTGVGSLDRLIVKSYDDRVRLTQFLNSSVTYCDFGCTDICSESPESEIYRERSTALSELNRKLENRAEQAGLLIEQTIERGPMIGPMSPSQLKSLGQADERKARCLDKQESALTEAQIIMKKLET